METQEQEKLMALQQKITLPDEFIQQWCDGLRRILHESNSAKVRNMWFVSTDMQQDRCEFFVCVHEIFTNTADE